MDCPWERVNRRLLEEALILGIVDLEQLTSYDFWLLRARHDEPNRAWMDQNRRGLCQYPIGGSSGIRSHPESGMGSLSADGYISEP
jgi:hypothetical protein